MTSVPFREAARRCAGNKRGRVLVVEDHADLSRLMTLLLTHHGFDAQAVMSGQLAVASARSFRPHFILLDIGLPGLNGYEVADLIRSDPDFTGVVIIAISAYGPDAHPDRACRAGFDYHLTKPVYIDELLPLLSLDGG